MAYRLVCIYEKIDSKSYRLRVEVCNDVGRMPPFLRNVRLDDVYKGVNESQRSLACLIYHSGCTAESPYMIDNQLFLQNIYVQDELRKCPYIYLRNSPRGSLRKGKFPLKPQMGVAAPEGQIIGKELYICDIGNWQSEIDTRFRLEHVLLPIPTGSTFNYPVVQVDGGIVREDERCAANLVSELGKYYRPESGTLDLKADDNPSEKLRELMESGWKVFVPNQKGGASQVYSHSTPSGIVWFSTDEFSDDVDSNKMLDCFLKSREYVESDGKIVLINSKDVATGSEKDLAVLTGATSNVIELYGNHPEIDISHIKSIVKSKVNASLRQYQIDGVLWLQKQRENKSGCLLADEMGLGKTLQVIAHLACVDTDKPHLVIAPVSLVFNWHNEINRFAPFLSDKVIITSYDQLRIHIKDYIEREYDTIVIDEAQVIKNRETQKYKAIAKLQCVHKIILTGTPIENSIEDIWSHFIMLNPGMLQMYNGIRKKGETMDSEQRITLSAKLLNRFILRRTKDEVLTQLPDKSEETIYVDLSDKERTVYAGLHKVVVRSLSSGISGRINSIVLEGLLRLRQACVSVNMLPVSLRQSIHIDSTKLNLAVNYAERIKAEGRKVLYFSQFVSALKELEGLMLKADVSYVKMYGDTVDRKTPVDTFQNDNSVTAFLISLKAGGVGLNLTAADTVILLDDWWNPAVEEQAMGRAHRIGQKHNVFVYRFVCKDTVEEKILQLQNKKRATVDLFENTASSLSIEDIKTLLS